MQYFLLRLHIICQRIRMSPKRNSNMRLILSFYIVFFQLLQQKWDFFKRLTISNIQSVRNSLPFTNWWTKTCKKPVKLSMRNKATLENNILDQVWESRLPLLRERMLSGVWMKTPFLLIPKKDVIIRKMKRLTEINRIKRIWEKQERGKLNIYCEDLLYNISPSPHGSPVKWKIRFPMGKIPKDTKYFSQW